MNTRTRMVLVPVTIVVAAVVVAGLVVRLRRPVPKRPPAALAPMVRVVTVHRRPHRFVVSTQGTVQPRTETDVVAEVSGRVLEVSPRFAPGGFFDAGEVMVRLDPRDRELAVAQARARLAQARVRERTEAGLAEVAREEWEELGRGGEPSPLATRQLQLEEARAALAAAEADLALAERNLERTRIRAPYACRVRRRHVDVGGWVAPGTPVARVYAVDWVEVPLPVRDEDLAFLDLPADFRTDRADGPLVRLHADFAGARREWTGHVARVEGDIDPRTRMIRVVARVDDPWARSGGGVPLPVGLFVEADIEGREVPDAVILPRTALRGESTVYVVDDESRLRARRVTVLRREHDRVVVGSGLADGDVVCVSLLGAVTDGMRVRIHGEDESGSDAEPPRGVESHAATPDGDSPDATARPAEAASTRPGGRP